MTRCRDIEITPALEARFERSVAHADPDECWLWKLAGNEGGYGVMKIAGSRVKATHVALALIGKPRPLGLIALHSCDVPACCNPAHLRWGTHAENSADAVVRGRLSTGPRPARTKAGRPAAWRRGVEHPHAKLTEDAVREIRSSPMGLKALARRFGVDRTIIRAVRRGETWKHVA